MDNLAVRMSNSEQFDSAECPFVKCDHVRSTIDINVRNDCIPITLGAINHCAPPCRTSGADAATCPPRIGFDFRRRNAGAGMAPYNLHRDGMREAFPSAPHWT